MPVVLLKGDNKSLLKTLKHGQFIRMGKTMQGNMLGILTLGVIYLYVRNLISKIQNIFQFETKYNGIKTEFRIAQCKPDHFTKNKRFWCLD